MGKELYKFRLIGILLFLAMIAGFSIVAMLLWNRLMPDIFGLPMLNYWQTLGLAVLFRIFFGGIGLGRFDRPGYGRDFGEHHANKLREKWMSMNEEERNEFIKKEKEFSHFHTKCDHLHHRGRFRDFFDGDERGRCGGGTPAEGGSERPPQAGCSEGGDFPPHKGGGDE